MKFQDSHQWSTGGPAKEIIIMRAVRWWAIKIRDTHHRNSSLPMIAPGQCIFMGPS